MAFYAFCVIAFVTVISALMVIRARNPVHSVLWLILTFFSSAGLFVLIGAEFLAMLLVVVYVGAVAVLFMLMGAPDLSFTQFMVTPGQGGSPASRSPLPLISS